MNPDLPPLIRSLLAPERYSGGVSQVTLVETHISWVLLAGEFAYKIKKPIKLSFLDFSTLAQRQACCQEELRLNQRYSPEIYLAVVGIFNNPQEPQLDGQGSPIEYAVKMRRFDEYGRLDRVCARGELKPAQLSDLARTLVAFHATAEVAPATSRFGAVEQVILPMRENFRYLAPLLPQPDLAVRLAALQAWTEAQFTQLKPLLAARKQAGQVRECHGDLHLGNLVLIDGQVRLFDCIEFNEDLRWIDVASEIAFTYVDLLAHDQPGLAAWFVNEVLSCSGDYEAAQVLRFYAVYRAMVRAKVAAIRTSQTQENNHEVMHYLELAERLVTPIPQKLVITHGLSGCGKTIASSELLQNDSQANTLRLRSDVERKRLYGLTSTQRSQSPTDAGIYAPGAGARTYQRLHDLTHSLLCAGWSVVVDAAFLKRADRATFRTLADASGAAFSILAPQASPEQLRQRILTRQALGQDASEATLAVLAQQMQVIEPLAADEI